MVRGKLCMSVVFPGLQCDMTLVIASIGFEELLATEALQSCLPHQLDLRTGQLWADGQSTLQPHQQRQVVRVTVFTKRLVAVPPDSEIVAPVSIRSPAGIPLGSLIEPDTAITETYAVLVGHTMFDTSNWSAEVLLINRGSDMVVLPAFSCIGDVVQVSAVAVARTLPTQPEAAPPGPLPLHLEEIVTRSHPSLGMDGRAALTDILHRYSYVFLAPGDPVTGCTQVVRHEIITNNARLICCGPRRLAPAGLRMEQNCVRDMPDGGQIEMSDSPWASPVVLVTKKDGSTRFCVDYRWLNATTMNNAYPLPRIDDSLCLLGRQQWFSTMDFASGYWHVAMSPDASRKAAFVTHMGLFQFRVMPCGLHNAPATFERLIDRVLPGMIWSRCLVYLDDVLSFATDAPEAMLRLTKVLERLSSFGLQLKTKKCTFMQTGVAFLDHFVGRAGLACDSDKL